MRTIIQKMLDQEVEVKIDGVVQKKTVAEMIINRLITAANKGQRWAIVEIIDRMDGKPKQEIDLDQGLTINWKKPEWIDEDFGNKRYSTRKDEGDGANPPSLPPGIQDDSKSGRDEERKDLLDP